MPVDALNWFIAFFTLSIFTLILRDISRRIGEARRMRKYYLLYDLCEAVLIICIVLFFLQFVMNFQLVLDTKLLSKVLKLTMMAMALVEVAVTLVYWGWLMPEVLASKKQ